MKNNFRKLFILSTTTIAAITLVLCMCLFDSDFQVRLIAPMLISMAWLALVGYANRDYLMKGDEN